MRGIDTNVRSACDKSLQHTYLDTRDLQQQPRSANPAFADQFNNVPAITEITDKGEGGDAPDLPVAVGLNLPGQLGKKSLDSMSGMKCFDEGNKKYPVDQKTNRDEFGYIVLDENAESGNVGDWNSQSLQGEEAGGPAPNLDRSFIIRQSVSISSSPDEEGGGGIGVQHTYLGLADLLSDPSHTPSRKDSID